MNPLRELMTQEAAAGFFALPSWLVVAGVLVPMLGLGVLLWQRRHRARLAAVFGKALLEQVVPRPVRIRRTLRDVARLVCVGACLVALAGPRHSKRIDSIDTSGVDVVVAVDLSRSMDAGDLDPSRLEWARRELMDLIAQLQGDRVGLVIFAGGAYPRMPLSNDYDALRMLVDELSTSVFSAQGSALHEAIDTGVQLLTADDTSAADKALVVFSDGEVDDVALAEEAAHRASEQGVRVFGVGVGTGPAPIPTRQGPITNASGAQVMSRPNPELLVELARITGGAFVQSVADDTDMARLYHQEIRAKLAAGQTRKLQQARWTQAHSWPLLLAVLAGLVGLWIGDGRRPYGAAVGVLFALGLAASGTARATSLVEGDQAYRAGQYRKAVQTLTELAMEHPGDADLLERLGAAHYRGGQFDRAARAWDLANQVALPSADRLYNAGNAHYQSGRLERALERYNQALDLDPAHSGALANKQLLQQELALRRAIAPPPPPEPDQQSPGDEGQQTSSGQPPQGESGERSESGESSENPSPPSQKGESSSDEPQSGSSSGEGERSESEREAEGGQPTQQDGGKKNPKDGQKIEDSPETDAVDLASGEGDPLGESDPSDGSSGQGSPTSQSHEPRSQAEKTLDGVKEGRPRVRIPGNGSTRPW